MINQRREATVTSSSQNRNADQRIIRSISTPPMTTPWRQSALQPALEPPYEATINQRQFAALLYWAQVAGLRAIDSAASLTLPNRSASGKDSQCGTTCSVTWEAVSSTR